MAQLTEDPTSRLAPSEEVVPRGGVRARFRLRPAPREDWSVDIYNRSVEEIESAQPRLVPDEPCPVCGETTIVPRFRVGGLLQQVVVCPNCGLGRFSPPPSAEEIADFYPPAYYGSEGKKFRLLTESLVRIVAARSARFFTRGLKRGARVLDVGCGRGVLLSSLVDRGFEAHGFEISAHAVLGADPRAQIRIAPDLQSAEYPDHFFDRVVIWHVLEHVPVPDQTLKEIWRVLRPGGTVAVAVPNFSSWQARWARADWFHLDLPRHLFHFPAAALRTLLQRTGFECQSEHHFSLRQNPFGWIQSALNRLGLGPRNGLYSILHAHRHQPHMRLPRWAMLTGFYLAMPLAIGLSIVAAAMRTGATVHIVARRPGSDAVRHETNSRAVSATE